MGRRAYLTRRPPDGTGLSAGGVVGRGQKLYYGAASRYVGVTIRLQALNQARAPLADAIRSGRDGLAAPYAGREDLLRVDALTDEILAQHLGAALGELLVVAFGADAVRMADDRHAVVAR